MQSYTCEEITQVPIPDYYRIHWLLKSSYGITQARLTELTGYDDCNFLLSDLQWKNGGPTNAILKVTNPIEARSDENIECTASSSSRGYFIRAVFHFKRFYSIQQRTPTSNFQVKICDILNENGISCPKTIKRLDGRDWASEVIAEGVQLPVRVFEVLPGANLENFNFKPELVQEIGKLLAKFHVVVDNSRFSVSVSHVPYIAVHYRQSILKEMELQLKRSLISIDKAQLITDCLAEFEDRIGNNCEHNEMGLIHSDFNETNILVCEDNGKLKVTGLLDFGDVHHSFRILDIAATVLYLHLADRLFQGVEFLAQNILLGYRQIREAPDCTFLLTAIKARLSCSLIYGIRSARINSRSENTEYVLRTQCNGWKVLQELHVGKFDVEGNAAKIFLE